MYVYKCIHPSIHPSLRTYVHTYHTYCIHTNNNNNHHSIYIYTHLFIHVYRDHSPQIFGGINQPNRSYTMCENLWSLMQKYAKLSIYKVILLVVVKFSLSQLKSDCNVGVQPTNMFLSFKLQKRSNRGV